MIEDGPLSEVWLAYANALLHILGNFVVALGLVGALRRFNRLRPSRRVQQAIVLAGTLCLLTAGIGKLGFSIQSWAGTTPRELLDRNIFLGLSHLGMFLVFTEWVWSFRSGDLVARDRG